MHRENPLGIFSCRKEPAGQWMAKGGQIAADTLFEPERLKARAIVWDQSDRGLHQGAQQGCKSDAVYMAAPDQTPNSKRSTLAQRAPSIHGPSDNGEPCGLVIGASMCFCVGKVGRSMRRKPIEFTRNWACSCATRHLNGVQRRSFAKAAKRR